MCAPSPMVVMISLGASGVRPVCIRGARTLRDPGESLRCVSDSVVERHLIQLDREWHMVNIQLLGGIRVTDEHGAPVAVGSAKTLVVLAALALSPRQAVPVTRLVELVWDQNPPATAAKALQWHVVRLRRGLGRESIVRTGNAYRLDIDDNAIDVARFQRDLDAGRVDAALAGWSGIPLAGFEAPGLGAIVDGLQERWLDAVERQLGEIAATDSQAAIARLTELCARYPLREGLWAHLMTALYRAGRQADALAAYRTARGHLVDELGVEPGPALRRLESSILAQDGTLAVPAAAAASRRPGNLPPNTDPLIGRDEVIAAIVAQIHRSSLVTLVGPGGVGKTRLALATARTVAAQRSMAAWFVELAQITCDEDVPRVVADTVGVTQPAGHSLTESITAALERAPAVLVLDNCEHVIDGSAALAQAVTASRSEVRVIATSRERLAVAAEQVLPVEPLEPTGPGVELFRARALAADPAFDATAQLADIVEICRRLDGIPLAIELAAARTRAITPADIRARLDDCLPLLAGGRRTAAGRHRTMTAAIRWSYDLLAPGERRLLQRLSIFAGAFDLAAAEAIGSDGSPDAPAVDDLLAGLVERSMVATEAGAFGRRLRLLEPVRQFATGLPPEEADPGRLTERYGRWCRDRLRVIGRQLGGPDEIEGVGRLSELWSDVRAAVALACARPDPDQASGLVRPIATELALRARHEIGDFAERILAVTPGPGAATRAYWLLWVAERYVQAGDAEAYDRAALRYGEPDHPLARYARAYVHGDGEALRRCLPDVVAELEVRGEADLGRFIELMGCGPLLSTGRFAEVDALVSALVERWRRHGPPSLLHQALQTLGYSASFQQRSAESARFFDEAATVDVPPGTLSANGPVAATTAFRRGEHAQAREILGSYISELLAVDNVVAASVVAVDFINMMAATDRAAEAAHMLRYLERANEFGALAATTLVTDAARRVVESAVSVDEEPRSSRFDDRGALIFMREALGRADGRG